MPEKNNNPEKELGATEPTTEKEPIISQDEIDALIKAMSGKSDLIEASGKKLDETIQEPGVKEATQEATDEVRKAETQAKEQIAQTTDETLSIGSIENEKKAETDAEKGADPEAIKTFLEPYQIALNDFRLEIEKAENDVEKLKELAKAWAEKDKRNEMLNLFQEKFSVSIFSLPSESPAQKLDDEYYGLQKNIADKIEKADPGAIKTFLEPYQIALNDFKLEIEKADVEKLKELAVAVENKRAEMRNSFKERFSTYIADMPSESPAQKLYDEYYGLQKNITEKIEKLEKSESTGELNEKAKEVIEKYQEILSDIQQKFEKETTGENPSEGRLTRIAEDLANMNWAWQAEILKCYSLTGRNDPKNSPHISTTNPAISDLNTSVAKLTSNILIELAAFSHKILEKTEAKQAYENYKREYNAEDLEHKEPWIGDKVKFVKNDEIVEGVIVKSITWDDLTNVFFRINENDFEEELDKVSKAFTKEYLVRIDENSWETPVVKAVQTRLQGNLESTGKEIKNEEGKLIGVENWEVGAEKISFKIGDLVRHKHDYGFWRIIAIRKGEGIKQEPYFGLSLEKTSVLDPKAKFNTEEKTAIIDAGKSDIEVLNTPEELATAQQNELANPYPSEGDALLRFLDDNGKELYGKRTMTTKLGIEVSTGQKSFDVNRQELRKTNPAFFIGVFTREERDILEEEKNLLEKELENLNVGDANNDKNIQATISQKQKEKELCSLLIEFFDDYYDAKGEQKPEYTEEGKKLKERVVRRQLELYSEDWKPLTESTVGQDEKKEEKTELSEEELKKEIEKIITNYAKIINQREKAISITDMQKVDETESNNDSYFNALVKFKKNTEEIWQKFKDEILALQPDTTLVDENSNIGKINKRFFELIEKLSKEIEKIDSTDEQEPQTFKAGDIVEYKDDLFEISNIVESDGVFYFELKNKEGKGSASGAMPIIKEIKKASEEQIKQFKKEKEGSGENPESTEKKKLPEKYKDIAVGQKYLQIGFPEQEGVNILNGNIEEIEISERGDNIIIYWRADNYSGSVNTEYDEDKIEKVDTGVWAKQEDLEEAKSKGFTLKKNHNTGEWELVKEKTGEDSKLTEQEKEVKNIIDEYVKKVENFKVEMQELKNKNLPQTNKEVEAFIERMRAESWIFLKPIYAILFKEGGGTSGRGFMDVKEEVAAKITNDELKSLFEKVCDDFRNLWRFETKADEVPKEETLIEEPKPKETIGGEVDENLKEGFEVGQKVVIRKDGVLEPGWEITSFKETKSLDGEIMARAEVKKGNERWEISVATLDELNNRNWSEIGKQAAIAGAGMLASIAGVRAPADIAAYIYQKHEVGKISETTKKLLEHNKKKDKFGDVVENKNKDIIRDKFGKAKSQTRILIDELNKELSHTKEGTKKHSEVRDKLAEVMKLNRKSIKEEEKKDKTVDEIETLEKALEAEKSKTGAELEKIQKLYLETKVSGMQAARETMNTVLTATGAFALRAPMYGIMDGIGKWQSLKKEKQQASDEFGKSIKDVKKEAEKVTFRELFVNPVVDTFRKATFQDEKGKGPRTGTQKAVDFARAAGKIGRYVGMTATGLTGFGTSFDNLLEGLSGKTNFTETAHNFTGNFERYGKIIKAGQEIYHNPSEIAKILLHEQPSTKAPLNAEALLHQQEQLTEKFPGLEGEKGELFTKVDPHAEGAGYLIRTREKSIDFDIIDKDGTTLHPLKIPFTDSHKTATEALNEYAGKKGIDPEQITNARVSIDVSNKPIPATIIQETYDDASSLDDVPEIQNKVGNVMREYPVLENKDLVHESNEILITAKDGRTFNLTIEKNNWDTLEQFYHDNQDIKPEDITSVDVVKGTSEFDPADLPERHAPAPKLEFNPLSEEMTPSNNNTTWPTDIETETPLSANQSNAKEIAYPTALETSQKNASGATDIEAIRKEYPAYEPASKLSSNIDSSLFNGNTKAEKSINTLLEKIDQQEKAPVRSQSTIDELTNKVRITVEKDLARPKGHQDIDSWLDYLKKENINRENIENHLLKKPLENIDPSAHPVESLISATDQKLRSVAKLLSILEPKKK